jgi:hypothetical protein
MGRSSRLWLWTAGMWLLVASPALALTRCDLRFDLESWSVFYKEGHGRGVIDCDNGQRAAVILEAKGGGVSLGASKIVDGTGNFSLLTSIDEVYGDYATAEAHAGMGPSAHAQIVTKGSISLALSGSGNGVDLGFALGRFTIKRGEASPRRAESPPPPREPAVRARDEAPIQDEDVPSSDPVPAEGY